MIVLEYHLEQFGVEWLKLKIYDEKQIAIGYYLPLKENEIPDRKREITVAVFTPAVGLMGEEMAGMLAATVRKFRQKDRKIAHWYYQELRRAYKNGVLETQTEHRNPRRRRG
jgi:hypothetical protein